MKKYILSAAVLAFLFSGTASAQGILGRLGERAKQAVENNIGNKIEEGVNNVLNGKKKDKDDKKKGGDADAEDADLEIEEADATAQNAKNDFVRGSVILFEDPMDGEQLGEFPSKWDIVDEGSLEVAMVNSKKYAQFTTDYNYLSPLMSIIVAVICQKMGNRKR